MNEAKPLPYNEENDHDPNLFKRLAENPSPKLVHPVRKIVFTIKSKDQGWVGGQSIQHKTTYKSSWTWFEAGLERFDSKQHCECIAPRTSSFARLMTAGDKNCVSDLRYNSSTAPAPDLPLCSLRSVIPQTEAGEKEGERKYVHKLAANPQHEIQRNRLATREWQEKEIVWSWTDDLDEDALDEEGRGRRTGNGEFVRSLKLGDIVSIWGKARFHGWMNNVQKVKIDVYWAV